MRPNHSPFCLHRPFPSYFISSIAPVLLSRTTLPTQKTLPRGSRTLISLSLFSFPFMRLHLLFIPHHRHPRGRRYYTKLRLADMYIRPPSCSSRKVTIIIVNQYRSSPIKHSPSFFPSFSPACFLVSAIVWWNRCPHDLGRLPPSFVLSLPLSCGSSPNLGRHFHSRSTYLRYSAVPRL